MDDGNERDGDEDVRREAVLLIEQARKDLPLSVRAAARRAEMSEAWWRAVVRGVLSSSGHETPAVPSVNAVLAMAGAVGLEPQVRQMLGLPVDADAFDGVLLPDGRRLRAMTDEEWETFLATVRAEQTAPGDQQPRASGEG